VRVPLFYRWPNEIPGGKKIGAPVEPVDLVPTLLDLIGLDRAGRDLQGRSVAAALRGNHELEPDRPVYLHRRHYRPQLVGTIPVHGEKFGIRLADWKYIVGEREQSEELFDLARDPLERHNVGGEFPEEAAALGRRLDEWRRTHERSGVVTRGISEEDRERLRALGYVE
jgi:arylsulfatase A-like enzyme